MLPVHKPLNEQVVLITGASSGIGRQSAIRFARAGAKLILVSRNESALAAAVGEIESAGGEAVFAVADVASLEQLNAAAETGIAKFGRIDTWVNNAGVGIYTKILKTDVADDRRLFDTNFWGIVNGSRIAVPYLVAAGGGALINLGSEVSDVAIPVQAMYAASKHAVKGFTDGLRQELMADKVPVTVTLIKPAAINTPFPQHARNNLDKEGTLPAPVYDVDIAADQILHAAEYGGRDLFAGGAGRIVALLSQHFPKAADLYMAAIGGGQGLVDRPPDRRFEGLYESRGFHQARGELGRDHHVQNLSLYGVAKRNPFMTTVAIAAGLSLIGAAAKAAAVTTRGSRHTFF
jgi:short-subunit dehydrogenase